MWRPFGGLGVLLSIYYMLMALFLICGLPYAESVCDSCPHTVLTAASTRLERLSPAVGEIDCDLSTGIEYPPCCVGFVSRLRGRMAGRTGAGPSSHCF